MDKLSNKSAERAVLAGIFRYGKDAFVDVADVVNIQSFTVDSNQTIYKVFEHIFQRNDVDKIDIASVFAAASEIGLKDYLDDKDERKHLQTVLAFPIELLNVRKMAAKLRKLQLARELRVQVKVAEADLTEVTGDESVPQILSIAEKPLFDYVNSLQMNQEEGPVRIGDGLKEYIAHLAANPTEQVGISTGLHEFDKAIGGGLRPKTVNVVGARPKEGKTTLADNISKYVSSDLQLPVLMCDTEMAREDHWNRMMAMTAKVRIDDIESGAFAKNQKKLLKLNNAVDLLLKAPYDYLSIAGMDFQQVLSHMRRWVTKKVGIGPNGRTNPCVIVYDYLKLMNTEELSNKNLAEFQILGFQMTELHNFAVRYDCPILAFVQLNRDGMTREGTDVVSQSDRIIWLCSNFSIFKSKSDEELASDHGESGNKKMVPIVCRHGPGLPIGDYINMTLYGDTARVIEGQRRNEVENIKDTFITDKDASSEQLDL